MSAVPMMVRELKSRDHRASSHRDDTQVNVADRTAEVDFGDVWVIVSGKKFRANRLGMRVSPKVYRGPSCFGYRWLPDIL